MAVSVGDLRKTLFDAENWIAEVRVLLAGRRADSLVVTVEEPIQLPSDPDVDHTPIPADAPAIVQRHLNPDNVLSGGIGPRIPCAPPTAVCDPMTELGRPITAGHLAVALRRIELMVAACRVLIEKMGPDAPIWPAPPA